MMKHERGQLNLRLEAQMSVLMKVGRVMHVRIETDVTVGRYFWVDVLDVDVRKEQSTARTDSPTPRNFASGAPLSDVSSPSISLPNLELHVPT